MDTNTYIKTTGSANSYVQQGMHRSINNVNWDVDYDGRHADIDLDVGHNGESTHYKAVLSNEDLANMLNYPSVNMPLEERLYNDFLVDRRVYKLEPILPRRRRQPHVRIIHTKKYKRPSSKSRTSSAKRRVTTRPKTMRIRFNNRSRSSSSSSRRSSSRN